MAYGRHIEKSPRRRKRDQQARKRQEARWASKSGPVATRIDPSIIRRPPTGTSAP